MKLILYTLFIFVVSSLIQAANISVSGTQTFIGGETATVIDSGSSGNFSGSTVTGATAVFDMTKDAVDFADLQITYNGGAGSSVMVRQTVNSQGLTDTGTISILVSVPTSGTASFQFDWYAPDSFLGGVIQEGASLIADPILYTSFDIDFNQFVAPDLDQLQYYAFNEGGTELHADESERAPLISFEDSGSDSNYTDPETAVQFLTKAGLGSHSIDVGKQTGSGNALFMFEFRDPSVVLGETFTPSPVIVPELHSLGLMAISLLVCGVFFRGRVGRRK
ncbi:hypothetical protein P3T73_06415 [Kiritimatiellota bacterium B12222]|nr:hypothetical protein P3T73_06415 [Kiritimatiellota bacterium B12222]